MQGWVARGCDAAVKQGIATVKGTGPTPFLGVGMAGDGPAVLSLRVKTASPGEGRIEWLDPKKPAVAPKSVPFALSGGDWQDITVSVPAEGRFGILRIYLPATNQPVDVDWIEFGRGKQAAPCRWDF